MSHRMNTLFVLVLPNRDKETLEKWLDEPGTDWFAAIEITCSDMWDAYQNTAAAKLPNARCTIDRFHVMKNLWPLIKNKENLKAEEKQELEEVFAVSQQLAACYEFKETFRQLFNQRLDLEGAEKLSLAWVTQVEACKYRALKAFAKTLRNWWTQIINYFKERDSNGFAEGVYLKIKMLNGRGYGYQNFSSFRLNILVSFG